MAAGIWPFSWVDPLCLEAEESLMAALGEPGEILISAPLSSWFVRLCPGASLSQGALVSYVCQVPQAQRAPTFFRIYNHAPELISPWEAPLIECLRGEGGASGVSSPPVNSRCLDPWVGRVFWSLIAREMGRDPQDFQPLGEAFNRALWSISSLTCYLTGEGQELTHSHAELAILALGDDIDPALAYALAGCPVTAERSREVGALLGEPRISAWYRAQVDGHLKALEMAAPEGIEVAWLVDALATARDRLMGVASTLNLMSTLQGGAQTRGEALKEGLRGGVRALLMPGAWALSVERQRFGMATSQDMEMAAPFFPRGTVEGALEASKLDREAQVAALLLDNPPGGLRYFPGWRGIPPDGDSLGLALRLGSLLKVDGSWSDEVRGRLEEWITYVHPNLDAQGRFPLWFSQGPEGATVDDPPIPWAGDDCTASRLSLVLGLLMYGGRRFEGLVVPSLLWALGRLVDGRLRGSFYYHRRYGESLLLSCLSLVAALRIPLPGCEDPRALGQSFAAHLMGTQRADGSLGSPMQTAWTVVGAAPYLGDEWDEALWRAGRYLLETQGASGLWAWEPGWRTLGKLGQGVWHGGEALSTAPCVEALSVLKARLLG